MYWLFMYAFKYIFLEMSTIKLQSEILLPAVSNVLDTADFATSLYPETRARNSSSN